MPENQRQTHAPASERLAPRPVISLIGFLNVYSMQSVLPLVMEEFRATPVQAGATVGATVLAVVILRFLQGLCVPGIAVTLMAYIAAEFPAAKVSRMTGVYIGGAVMGGFSGRFITGQASHFLGWRRP